METAKLKKNARKYFIAFLCVLRKIFSKIIWQLSEILVAMETCHCSFIIDTNSLKSHPFRLLLVYFHCRTCGLSNQWDVELMGCPTTDTFSCFSNLWAVGLMGCRTYRNEKKMRNSLCRTYVLSDLCGIPFLSRFIIDFQCKYMGSRTLFVWLRFTKLVLESKLVNRFEQILYQYSQKETLESDNGASMWLHFFWDNLYINKLVKWIWHIWFCK